MPKNFITTSLSLGLMRATLCESGFDQIDLMDGYLFAKDSSGKNQDLLIYPVSRKLSRKNGKYETPHVLCPVNACNALRQRSQLEAGGLVPCVGFGIAKYDYQNCEVIIIPLTVWDTIQHEALSVTTLGVYYNYEKNDGNLPSICRGIWCASIY